jgi:hypothetical protein
MTKPTGRPRGRPKTKEYVTLMARVPQDLADRVQRYAGLHQQPLSVVLRDGLELLLEDDRYQPFLSDSNTGSTHPSDREAASTIIVSDIKEDLSAVVADSPVAQSSLASDTHEAASHEPAQPRQLPEPEPADRDSLEWRRWAVLEQVRTAQAPAKPGDIARQIGSTSALVRHDLEHWRQQGRVQRDVQGGYVSRRAS